MFTTLRHCDLECELDTMDINTMSHAKSRVYAGTHLAKMRQLPTNEQINITYNPMILFENKCTLNDIYKDKSELHTAMKGIRPLGSTITPGT